MYVYKIYYCKYIYHFHLMDTNIQDWGPLTAAKNVTKIIQ